MGQVESNGRKGLVINGGDPEICERKIILIQVGLKINLILKYLPD